MPRTTSRGGRPAEVLGMALGSCLLLIAMPINSSAQSFDVSSLSKLSMGLPETGKAIEDADSVSCTTNQDRKGRRLLRAPATECGLRCFASAMQDDGLGQGMQPGASGNLGKQGECLVLLQRLTVQWHYMYLYGFMMPF